MIMQAFVAADGDDVVFQAPVVGFEGEGGVDVFEEVGDGLFEVGLGGEGPEGGYWGELVALDA